MSFDPVLHVLPEHAVGQPHGAQALLVLPIYSYKPVDEASSRAASTVATRVAYTVNKPVERRQLLCGVLPWDAPDIGIRADEFLPLRPMHTADPGDQDTMLRLFRKAVPAGRTRVQFSVNRCRNLGDDVIPDADVEETRFHDHAEALAFHTAFPKKPVPGSPEILHEVCAPQRPGFVCLTQDAVKDQLGFKNPKGSKGCVFTNVVHAFRKIPVGSSTPALLHWHAKSSSTGLKPPASLLDIFPQECILNGKLPSEPAGSDAGEDVAGTLSMWRSGLLDQPRSTHGVWTSPARCFATRHDFRQLAPSNKHADAFEEAVETLHSCLREKLFNKTRFMTTKEATGHPEHSYLVQVDRPVPMPTDGPVVLPDLVRVIPPKPVPQATASRSGDMGAAARAGRQTDPLADAHHRTTRSTAASAHGSGQQDQSGAHDHVGGPAARVLRTRTQTGKGEFPVSCLCLSFAHAPAILRCTCVRHAPLCRAQGSPPNTAATYLPVSRALLTAEYPPAAARTGP